MSVKCTNVLLNCHFCCHFLWLEVKFPDFSFTTKKFLSLTISRPVATMTVDWSKWAGLYDQFWLMVSTKWSFGTQSAISWLGQLRIIIQCLHTSVHAKKFRPSTLRRTKFQDKNRLQRTDRTSHAVPQCWSWIILRTFQITYALTSGKAAKWTSCSEPELLINVMVL